MGTPLKAKNGKPLLDKAFRQSLSKPEKLRHAANRLTFGPRTGDIARINKAGLKKWIDGQLHPETLQEDPELTQHLRSVSLTESGQNPLTLTPVDLHRDFPKNGKGRGLIARDLSEAKVLRAIYSTHQLEELMVDFWFNHFNVYLNKGADRYFVPAYERDVIRPHVFGRFYDLLLATAQSPAMLFYLDNWRSSASAVDATGSPRKAVHGLNENYGRELLELHTLGVDGGYTQQDVVAVARCFTGWTIVRPGEGGGFFYNDKLHDKGQKVVLGHTIPAGGGMGDGLQVLRLLSAHPSTARFISLKLARRFVADTPPASLIDRMSEAFRQSDGDLRRVVSVMLNSREFWSKGAYEAKVKMPLEMVASAVRATGASVASAASLATEVGKLGEPLYRRIDPAGYSAENAQWVNSAALLERMNFGLALAQNKVPGVVIAGSEVDELKAARNSGLDIGSPGFQLH